jgi:excisionase family DNA binding protein
MTTGTGRSNKCRPGRLTTPTPRRRELRCCRGGPTAALRRSESCHVRRQCLVTTSRGARNYCHQRRSWLSLPYGRRRARGVNLGILQRVKEPTMMDDSRPNDQFLTVAEVAYMMRLSRATVYRLLQSGRLPAVRFGRSYRVSERAMNKFIAEAALEDRSALPVRFE